MVALLFDLDTSSHNALLDKQSIAAWIERSYGFGLLPSAILLFCRRLKKYH